MSMNLKKAAEERILITAHRGVSAGNIPCNTIPAYDAALMQGADMIEVDANMSLDGTLYSFHPKMEPAHLNVSCNIQQMHDGEIKDLRYVNYDRTPTQWGICTLDEIFARYKGKCFINVDKYWLYPRQISDLIRHHGIEDQIVVKCSPKKEYLDIIEEYAPEIPYLPIISRDDGIHEELLKRNINYVGTEILFATESDPLASPAYVEKLHADGKLAWINSIIYNYKAQLAGGHSDDCAISTDPEASWGWLADQGYDIIQTDWPLSLRLFLEQTGRRYRKITPDKE